MDSLIAIGLFAGVWFVLAKYYKKNGHAAWKRHLAGGSVGMLASIIFIIIIAPDVSTAETAMESATTEVASTTPDLGMTPDAYVSRFNALMKELDRPHRMTVKITEGPVKNSFKSSLNQRLVVMGTVDKDSGKVVEVLFIGTGNNTLDSGLDVFVTGTVTLAAAVRDGTIKDVTAQVLELSKQFDETEKKEMVERVYRNVKYFHMRNDQLGTWYGASAV